MDIIERRTVHELGRVKIEVQRVYDDSADSSYLGEFCEYDSKHTPRNENQKLVHRDSGLVLDHHGIWRDERGRIQAEPPSYRNTLFREYQYTFHDNGHERISYALADNRRMEGLESGDWCYTGVRAVVTFSGVVIGESSVWGIESDSDEFYFQEVEQDEVKEALREARAFRSELSKDVK